MFDVLAEASGLLGDAVAVQAVDLIFDAQRLRLLVLIGWDQRGETRSELSPHPKNLASFGL